MGLEGFTNYGIKTTGGELVAFIVQPTNISVLSHANVEQKITHTRMMLFDTSMAGDMVEDVDGAKNFDLRGPDS